jgi:hypothetical protein
MTRRLTAILVSALAFVPARAVADHGGPLRDAPMSPLTVALISAGVALVAGVLVVIIVMALTKKGSE